MPGKRVNDEHRRNGKTGIPTARAAGAVDSGNGEWLIDREIMNETAPPQSDPSLDAPPDLSIILINWRMGKDVAGVLPCIEQHKHRCRIETILVNKPSEDGTEELVAEKYQWVRLIRHDIFGIAEMRNVGLRAAQGRYCLILDADTELKPGCLDGLTDFLDKHPRVGGCGGHTVRLNGELEYNVKRFYDFTTVVVRRSPIQKWWPDNPWTTRHLMKDKNHEKPFYGDWMAGACFCMRRETIEEVGLFDQNYYFGFEDVDWCWRAKRLGWRIAFNPYARIIHKVQRLSDKGWNKMAVEHLKSGLRFWWKTRHQGLNWAWPNRPAAASLPDNPPPIAGHAQEKRPDLSVIVVNFNCRGLLRDCLESLAGAAPQRELEIIVVDNASSDGAPQMVREQFPHVKLIANADNRGFTHANNQGIEIARGRYMLLLNNDTRVLPAAFEKAIAWMDRNPDAGAAGLKLLNEDGSLQLSCRRFPSFSQALFNRHSALTRIFPANKFSREYLMTDFRHDRIQDVDWVSGACLMLRREIHEQIGGLDERFFMYSEDVDYCYRVWAAGHRVVYLPFARVTHLIGQSSRRNRALTIRERHRSMYRFYKKHYSRSLMFVDLVTWTMIKARCGMMLAGMKLKGDAA
ncbi:glycosyltransferase [Candidatus Sumerlaeota bacterium]|nr:glycosyltransferase [Candidatus Sumerlaeota bacterium]